MSWHCLLEECTLCIGVKNLTCGQCQIVFIVDSKDSQDIQEMYNYREGD